MTDILSIVTLAMTGIATITNVILVLKRYKKLRNNSKNITEMKKKINLANDNLRDANKIFVEIEQQNNGVIDFDKVQKDELERLIEELNFKIKELNMEKEKSF